MNREDIIRMARVAGCHDNGEEFRFVELRYLERFAALVAAAERERNAQTADAHASIEGIAQRIAAEIRGQQ